MEHAKTMVFIVREAYREVPGRAREPLFPRGRREGASRGVWRRIWADFVGFGSLLGSPGASIFGQKSCFFLGLILGGF